MKDKNKTSTLSLHALVEQAKLMKDCLIKGTIDDLGEILDYGFQQKKMYDYFDSTALICQNTITPIMVINKFIKPNTITSVKVNSLFKCTLYKTLS